MPDKKPKQSNKEKFQMLRNAYFTKMKHKYAKKANSNPDAYRMTDEEKQATMSGLKSLLRKKGSKNVGHHHTWDKYTKPTETKRR